ncbi:peptidoglycan-binding protein [Roseisolibacter sp. H3M3-2]|uniref:peptidoglycan-binding domain-containing protein n=1 Tax=Roseisolibacter sp. H3M3-2 TaxID=3031323 RepID=UPI0023D9D8C4|nr:peptidoglycan-binding protein [Roseisolibacter sp. H3M3-2]MDF1503563.1 peptidoglycan-binding protein [Roseisolibacter sp. H3M3-2]
MPRTRTSTTATYTPATATAPPAEATHAGDVQQGARGARTRLVQEWLNLHGVGVSIDGGFGAATAAGVRAFQQRAGLPRTGAVDRATFDALVAPMLRTLRPIAPPAGATLGAMVVAYAKQHLAEHPREIGGQNMGPWVRMYMDGNQGKAWPWCAGFATFVLRQAARTLGVKPPVVRTFSCDVLAGSAQGAQCLVGASVPGPRDVTPGSLFLVKRTHGDWDHVGIVSAVERDVFHTIEGNTNDSGDREGYEVCARVRNYEKKDFVRIE